MLSPSRRPFDDPAADAGHLLIRIGLVVLAFAVPISTLVLRRALFTLLPVAAGLLVVASTLLPRQSVKERLWTAWGSPVAVAGLWLLGWSTLSLAWTPFPQDGVERLLREFGTVLLAVVAVATLPERSRVSNLYLFPIGLAAAAVATLVAAVLDPAAIGAFQDADSNLERAVFALVMLFWPAVAALAVRQRWTAAGALTILVILSAMAAWTSIALVALAFGAIAFALATFGPSRLGLALGILAGALVVFGPLIPILFGSAFAGFADVMSDRFPPLADAAESLRVWATVAEGEPFRLLTGHGLDMAARATQIGYLPQATPRSLLFSIWYDLGLVGAVAAAVLVGAGLAAAGRCSATLAPFLLAEIVGGLVILFWGLDTTQLWWITLLSGCAIAFACIMRGQYRTERPSARLTARLIEPPLR